MKDNNHELNKDIIENCPHCGHKLSPWQQVLLSVDRILTCKHCWYRIILDVPTKAGPDSPDKTIRPKDK